MAELPPIRSVIGLPPDATVEAFAKRDVLRATVRWSEMWHEDHARAFTVAKVAKLDMLGEIQASLADVLANGGTFEQWQKNLVPYLQQQGWWGDVQNRELTGTSDVVTVGSRRLRTIYDTNLRVSRAAGQWTRIQALKATRPFLRYTAVLDSRTRPAHRAWHGTILPVDHPWWDIHFPPCGWFCRCTVRQLSQRDLDAKGWKVTANPPGGAPVPFYPAGSTVPVMVPPGISPGFGYNPGKASMAAIADKAARTIERTATTDLAAARSTLDELVQSDAFPAALAGARDGFPVMVLDDDTRAALGNAGQVPLLPGSVADKAAGAGVLLPDLRTLPALGSSPDHVGHDSDAAWLIRRGDGQHLAARLGTEGLGQLIIAEITWLDDEALADLLNSFVKD